MARVVEPVLPTPLNDLVPEREALVYGAVVQVDPARQVMVRSRGARRVQDVRIRDPSGEATLVLWGDEVELVSPGDQVVIFEAWVKRFRGSTCVSLGRYGRLLRLPPLVASTEGRPRSPPTRTEPPSTSIDDARAAPECALPPAIGAGTAVGAPSLPTAPMASAPSPTEVEVLVPTAALEERRIEPGTKVMPPEGVGLPLGYHQMIWGLRRQRMRENRNSDGW